MKTEIICDICSQIDWYATNQPYHDYDQSIVNQILELIQPKYWADKYIKETILCVKHFVLVSYLRQGIKVSHNQRKVSFLSKFSCEPADTLDATRTGR